MAESAAVFFGMRRLDIGIALTAVVSLVVAFWRYQLVSNVAELLGFLTGLACVYLVIYENVWNFPLGIASNCFFFMLFVQVSLYGDAGLQIVYIGLAGQGWYWWLRRGNEHNRLLVSHVGRRQLLATMALAVAGCFVLMKLLRVAQGSAPFLDSLTTILSLVAQYFLNRKYIENWVVWIVADVLYIYLYLQRGLLLTALLYAVFIAMCLAGLAQWRRSMYGTSPALAS